MATVSELEKEKDPKKARMVLSMGHEVVRPGYSRLLGVAARVADGGEELGNPNRVCQEYDMDQWTYWVTRDSRCDQDGYSGRQADQVTWDSWGNQDYDSGQWTD
jgi:hypothetical protein